MMGVLAATYAASMVTVFFGSPGSSWSLPACYAHTPPAAMQ